MTSELEAYFRGTCGDEDCGDVQEIGFHTIFRGPVVNDDPADADAWNAIDADTRSELAKCAGVIVRTDNQGFVEVCIYDTAAELDSAWQSVLDADAEFHADDEDERQ